MPYSVKSRIESRAEEFVALWLDPHASKSYIRERIGCGYGDLEVLRKRYHLPEKQGGDRVLFWEPTEDEIEARKQEIQAGWSEGRRSGRETAKSRQAAELKEFRFDRKTMSFS